MAPRQQTDYHLKCNILLAQTLILSISVTIWVQVLKNGQSTSTDIIHRPKALCVLFWCISCCLVAFLTFHHFCTERMSNQWGGIQVRHAHRRTQSSHACRERRDGDNMSTCACQINPDDKLSLSASQMCTWQTDRRAMCKPEDQAESGPPFLWQLFSSKHASLTAVIMSGFQVILRLWSRVFDCNLRCRSDSSCLREGWSTRPLSSRGPRLIAKPPLGPPTPPPLHLRLLGGAPTPGWRCRRARSRSQSRFGSPTRRPPAAAAPLSSPSTAAALDVRWGIQEEGRRVWLLSV